MLFRSEVNEKLEMAAVIEEAQRDSIFDEVSEGLADTQKDKFRKLSEGIDFDIETYEDKLKIVKEQYFGDKKAETDTGVVQEEADEINEEVEEGPKNPEMARYTDFLSKSKKY